jgi:drug/metabolite transporter (DMT)-like permease
MVFTGACSYGILSTLVKLAYTEGYNTAEISVTQAFIGMCVLWIFVFFQKKRAEELSSQPAKAVWWPLLFTGATIGLATFLYYLSVRYISASVAVVIMMQFTWISILLDWLFFKKKPQWKQLAIIGVILAGTVMASGMVDTGSISKRGIWYALGTALLYAIYIVANSRTAVKVPALKKSAVMMLGSTAGILAVNAHHLILDNHFDLGLFKWGISLALFGTVIPPLLFAAGIPKIGAGLSAILMTAELPVAVICAHIILGEQVSPVQWLGITLMLLAMVMLNLKKDKRTAAE